MAGPKRIRTLTLERRPCYGPCPVYQVTVSADGHVAWEGGMFTDVIGPREWRVPIATVTALEQALARAGFIELRDSYIDQNVTDNPSARIVAVFNDGSRKAVDHYHGDLSAPRALSNLESRIDRLLGTKTYIGRGGSTA